MNNCPTRNAGWPSGRRVPGQDSARNPGRSAVGPRGSPAAPQSADIATHRTCRLPAAVLHDGEFRCGCLGVAPGGESGSNQCPAKDPSTTAAARRLIMSTTARSLRRVDRRRPCRSTPRKVRPHRHDPEGTLLELWRLLPGVGVQLRHDSWRRDGVERLKIEYTVRTTIRPSTRSDMRVISWIRPRA
jgi:hypothetical protein